MTAMSPLEAAATIAGLAVVTVVTRGFFLYTRREPALPGWLRRGLRYAPIAALAAVLGPEVLLDDGALAGWRDARLYAAIAAIAWFRWRGGILGTIVTGMAVLVPLKLGLGW